MIARLAGRLERREPGRVLLDVGGVGYEVHIPLSTFYALPAEPGPVCLEVHTHVREDAITLFGFATLAEKTLFEKLIGVSGVGPKLACTLLSGLPPDEVASAIRCAQGARLCTVPGIGRKTAERIVLELRDKMPAPARDASSAPAVAGSAPAAVSAVEDAVSALVNLGYREAVARKAVLQASGGAGDLESLLREGLRALAAG